MARDIAVVSGYLVRCPLGGYAWQNLHYLVGLESLGFEPYFFEHTARYSYCFEPRSGNMSDDPRAGVAFAESFFGANGFAGRWVFEDSWRGTCAGLSAAERDSVIADARVWISLATVNEVPQPRRGREGTIFIDIDPGYTQIQAAQGDAGLLELLRQHRSHFTIGEHIGTPTCAVPSAGFDWKPTRQPVVPSLWAPAEADEAAPWTTIGRWDEQRREVEVGGEIYSWRKRSEWFKFLSLPRHTGERFLLAMDVAKNPEDLVLLREHGWEVVDPVAVSGDADAYRDFIRTSKGEFTVAKDLNVRLRTGWFSDRAACYLAAGRPVINQETGFDAILREGSGVFGFRTLEEAVEAFARIRADYRGQAAAARRVAEEKFDATVVLRELIERA